MLLLLLLLLLSILRITPVIPLLLSRFVRRSGRRRRSGLLSRWSTDVPRRRGDGRILMIRRRAIVMLFPRPSRG